MSAPLVVNTKDNTTWVLHTVTRAGLALYAVAGACACPSYLLATLEELAEHGIVGSADALPMPVGPEPRCVEDELTGARLSLWEEEQTTARLRLALESAKRGRRDLRADASFAEGSRLRWRKAAIEAERERDALRARVTELEVERHSTNEALDDAVQALRKGESAEVLALTVYRAEYDPGVPLGTYTNLKAAQQHCETFVRCEEADGDRLSFDWIPDDEDDPAIWELVVQRGEDETTTGYCVAVVDVASAFDEEADE